jgi:outer membrane protein assembly complex protein YaeT
MAAVESNPDVQPKRTFRLRRLLAIFGAALLVLAAALLLFLHTPPARRFVISQVTNLLERQHIEFNTDELDYNLFNLRFALHNVRVRSQDAPDLPPFAHIDRLSVDLSLTQLLRRRYVLQSGEADGVTLHYVVDAQGRDNLPRPPRDPEQPSRPLDYLIEDLRVTNASVHYEERARQIDAVLPVSSLEVEGHQLTDRHTVRLAAAKGMLIVQGRKVALDALKGALEFGEDDVRLEQLEALAEGARVTLSGAIRQFADPIGDLDIRGSADAARVATMVDIDDPFEGSVEIDASVTGRLSAPVIEGRVKGANVAFRNLSGLQIEATAAYDVGRKEVTIYELQARAPFGEVDGHGLVSLAGPDPSKVTATISGLDLAALMRAFETPYVVASRADARLQAEWPGLEYLQASGSATATLTPAAPRASKSTIPLGGRVHATGRPGALDVLIGELTAPGVNASGRLRVAGGGRLDGRANLRIADVSRAAAGAEAVLAEPAGSLLAADITGAVESTLNIGGTVASPVVAARIAAPALEVGEATGLAVIAEVTYAPAQVSVHRADLQWQEAQAHVTGTVGLTNQKPLDLSFGADAVQLAALLRAARRTDVPASGVLSLHGKVSGTAAQPAVSATLNGRELVAYRETWGTLAARVNLVGRELRVPEFAIDKPQPQGRGRIAGRGTYHLDRRIYSADLRTENVEFTQLTLADGRPLRGTFNLEARGAGSIDSPAGTVSLTAAGVEVDTYKIGALRLETTVANQQATIAAALPAYAVTANGSIGVHHPYPVTGTVRIDDLQLASLPLNLETPLEGQIRASAELSGNVAGDEGEVTGLRALATIDAFDGSWNGQPFQIDAPAVLRYADDRLGIDRLQLLAPDTRLALKGELPLSLRRDAAGSRVTIPAPGAIDVEARADLATLARYAPADIGVTASGSLTLTGTLRGTLQTIDPDLSIVIDGGSVVTPRLQPGLSALRMRTRVSGGEAQIERLDAHWGEARITATGRLPLEALPALPVDIQGRGGSATFVASIEGLDVAQIPGAPAGLTGRLSLEARMAAARADLAALEGQIRFPELQLDFRDLTLEQEQPSVITLGGGTARVEQFTLAGSVGTITASGTVGLTGNRPIDVDASGNLNVAALSMFTDLVRAEGDATLKIAARGTTSSPELDGFIDLADATFAVDEPTIAAENVHARFDLSGRRVTLTRLTGSLNGGTLAGTGFVELGSAGIADGALEVTADDVAFDAPLDLRSLSDSTIRLSRRGDRFVVSGQVTLDEAGLTGDINFDEGLLATMNARPRLDLTEQRNAVLEQIEFDLNVDTASPILVDNNLARAEVTADLRLVGTPYEPGLAGQLRVLEDGEIRLNERRYQVERGVISFLGERGIQPSLDLLLNTSASNYDITIAVTGTPDDTETTLTADPTLPEPDIMALLVTGRTLEEMRGEEFEIAQEQVLSYLAGRVGSGLGRGVERATGLDTVRIEPTLIANEVDPSARLTIAEDVADDLELVYSTSLTDSNDQMWVLQYDLTRRFQTRGVRQSDNSYRVDLRHDVRLGGQPEPRRVRRQRPTVHAIEVTGDGRLPEQELRALLELEVGDDFDFFAARRRVDRIEEALEERGRLQSRVRLQRETGEAGVNLTLRVIAGPRVTLVFEGVTPPEKVVDEIRTQWRRGVFDTQRLDDSRDEIRGWLMRDRYLQPTIDATVEDRGADERVARFRINRGIRFERVTLAFEGARGIEGKELDRIIDEQNLEQQLFTDPTQVTELLERYYHDQGYLVASVDEPRYDFAGTQARVIVRVSEGPRFVVRGVTAAGNAVIPNELLLQNLPVVPGDPFLPFAGENSLQRIRDLYWRRGYNDVHVDYALTLDRDGGRVDVRFTVTEGTQSVIAGIDVIGSDEASQRLVREQLELRPSDPLDLGRLARSRKNLYETQAFSIVDITRHPLSVGQEQQPVQLTVAVREVQPIQLRYGLSYDTERGPGGVADVSNHNSLGKARVLGLHSRYDSQRREARAYFNQPSLLYWPIETTAALYYTEERNPDTTLTRSFHVDRLGVSIQQERTLADSYVWNYGFRHERTHVFDPEPGGVPGEVLDEHLTVSPLNSAVTRETRDDLLDATKGSFLSQSFAYSPSWLASTDSYIKYLGQYFHYIPLQPERRKQFTNEVLRPRLVYAVGVRVGLARGFGGSDVPRSERFFAGGSTTLRGFEQNAVGPIDSAGVPLGGQAMLVLNNELRMPLLSIFDGVVFSDVGNVFPGVADFSLTDLRKTAGVGLRARTRWFLLRADYGFVLDRRAGERRGRFYFSLGQAF